VARGSASFGRNLFQDSHLRAVQEAGLPSVRDEAEPRHEVSDGLDECVPRCQPKRLLHKGFRLKGSERAGRAFPEARRSAAWWGTPDTSTQILTDNHVYGATIWCNGPFAPGRLRASRRANGLRIRSHSGCNATTRAGFDPKARVGPACR
jgi:hypothetical protein